MTNQQLIDWVTDPVRSEHDLQVAAHGLGLPYAGLTRGQLVTNIVSHLGVLPASNLAAWSPPPVAPPAPPPPPPPPAPVAAVPVIPWGLAGLALGLAAVAAGLFFLAWSLRPVLGVEPQPTPAPTAAPTQAPKQPTAAPAVPTQPAPPAGPTVAPAAPTAAPQPTQPAPSSACNRHGTQAWSDSTKVEGHNRSPVGGLQEVCWIVIETLRASPPVQGYVAVLPPKHVAWIDGHAGGTGWFINGEAEARTNAEKLRREIFERDGLNPIVVHLDRGEIFPLLAELQSAPRGPAAGTSPAPGSAPAPAGPTVAGRCQGGVATGPAIVEHGPSPTVVKVSAGQTQPINQGGCFAVASQQALESRWPSHRQEFLARFPQGQVVER